MQDQILVNITPQETRVATMEDGVVQDLHIERTEHLGLVGNIYLCIVKRVLPGMQSAFIEIGLERAAFLHIADVIEQRQNPNEVQRIEKLLHEGQPVMVQVMEPSSAVETAHGPSGVVEPVGRAITQVPAGTAPTRVRMVPTTDGDGYSATWAASTVCPIGTLTFTVPGS